MLEHQEQGVDRLCLIESVIVHKQVHLCRYYFHWSSIPPSDPVNLVLQLINNQIK